MKKILFSAAVLALAFFAGSCQRENLEPVQHESTVTYSVKVPGAIDTKAVGDGYTAYYEVYRQGDIDNPTAYPIYKGSEEFANGSADIQLEFVNDQKFVVLFWAQTTGVDAYDIADLRKVTMSTTANLTANNANYDVFAGKDIVENCKSEKNGNVTLVRPVAQLNIATTTAGLTLTAGTTDKIVALSKSDVKVYGLGKSFNVATNSVELETDPDACVTYEEADCPKTAFGTGYTLVAMSYIGFIPQDGLNVKVDFNIMTADDGTINHVVSNVPVKPNYRTNIVGNLISGTQDYSVTLDADWEDPDGGNMEVVIDGLVKNINGDYEVATAKGLAYAINNLWAEGGNFYLTAAEYDMTGLNVTAPTIPAGVTLNIYGETPVVTRAMTSIAGITIKGLDSIIETIADGANVSISGVELVDEGSVLVETNSGTLVVSESTGEEDIVGNGNAPVEADKVKDIDTLVAALASDVKVIELAADIEATDVIAISRSVTINGNGNTLYTSANRAIRIEKGGINVVINNLKIVSSSASDNIYYLYGVSINSGISNSALTLNNCDIQFTYNTTLDNTYAVNIVGGTGHKLTVNGGVYEGANVINVRGTAQTVTVKNATLNSKYPYNDQYYGACIWVEEKQESSVYAEGNTFNGNNAIAFNLGTGTALEEKDNVDNTKMVVAKVGEAYYTSLAEAFDAVETEATIKVLHNTDMSAVTVKNGKTITLDLNGKTITGVDTATGSYGLITNKGNLTVVGPGSMTLTATNNREWNAYSSVISNTVGGNLTVEDGAVLEHLGGTDMAYGIDNLTNGKGTSAITTVNDATIKSTYRAIRQFLNGTEATNTLIVNADAVIEGANKSIWMQDPNTHANSGKLVVEEGAKLYGDVYLYVCAGSESWPVSASIPASTLMDGSEVMTGNLPEGYSVEEKNGVYEVTYKSPAQARLEALINEGGEVILTEDIELSSPIEIKNVTVTLDLSGKTITAPLSSAFEVKTGGDLTIKKGNIVAYESTVRAIGGKVTVESGEYTSTGTALDSPATYRYSLDSREGGELIINGGTFKSTNGMINVGSTVTINGGKFENIVEKTMTRHFAYVSAPLTINDGEFYGKANSSAGGCFFCGAAAGGDIQVNGGKFTSLWTSGSVNKIFESYYGGTITVTGGFFNTNGGIATFVTENTDDATKAAYPYVAQ